MFNTFIISKTDSHTISNQTLKNSGPKWGTSQKVVENDQAQKILWDVQIQTEDKQVTANHPDTEAAEQQQEEWYIISLFS